MDPKTLNKGGYKGTGQYGVYGDIEYIKPDVKNPYGSYKQVSSLSINSALTSLNKDLGKLNNISPTTAPGYVAPETKETPIKEQQPQGVSAAEALGIYGSLSNLEKQADGTYLPKQNTKEQNAVDVAEQAIGDAMKQWETYDVESDPGFQLIRGDIRDKFVSLIDETKKFNASQQANLTTLGYRSGSTQYAGAVQSGIISEAVTQGTKRVGDIISLERQAVNEARTAYTNGKFSDFSKRMDSLQKILQNKKDALNEFNDNLKKTLTDIQERNQQAQQAVVQASRDSAVSSLIDQGVDSPSMALNLLNYDEKGNQIGDFTFDEVNKIYKGLKDSKTTVSGEYGEYQNFKNDNPNYKGGFFDYLKQKKGATTVSSTSGGAGSTGVITGNISRDAQTIMSGNSPLKLSDLSTKDNYRAKVAAELNTLKSKALESGDIIGVIRASAGGKEVSDTFLQSFEKGMNVVAQVADLQTAIDKETTGPIWGTIRSLNPYDTKAATIKAQLQAIVPNLARGVYGEVGVLTDNDIKNYSQTLPNLKSTEDVRNAIIGITLKSVQRSLENKIKSQAGFGRDVSGIESVYLEVKKLADQTLAPLEAQNVKNELDNAPISNASVNATTEEFFAGAK